jgi:hypothetical protein
MAPGRILEVSLGSTKAHESEDAMNRIAPSLLAALLVPALACVPAAGPDGETPPPIRPATSELADCLLAGGRFEEAWARDLDAAGIAALAVAPDGTVAVGEGLGAVGILREALGGDATPDAFHEILLPAGGQAVTSLAFSADGRMLVSGDAAGQVASTPIRTDEAWLWQRVSEDAIRSVAARTGGEALAWVDEGWAGRPSLWAWPEAADAPDPVDTFLWSASATAFSRDDALWIVAGDWYGVPAFDVRLADAPEAPIAEWMMTMETLGEVGGAGTFTAMAVSGDAGWLVAAGAPAFEGGGFLALADLSGLDRTPPAPSESAPAETAPAALNAGRFVASADHRPVAVHLLPGDAVFLTRGEAGDVVAWAVDGLERLASVAVAGLGATAIDWIGSALLAGDETGRLTALTCAP